MTIAFITDTHAGARSSSNIFREYMKWWYEEHFFKDLKANHVKNIIHGGDFFDNRNAITLQDIDFIVNWFAGKLVENDLHMTVILGNHDVAFKNTNRVHSLSMLQASAPKNVRVVEEAELTEIDGQWYALVPWINSTNYDSTLEFLDKLISKPSVIVVGHLEIANAKMYANSALCEHGLDAALFAKFQQVWSGHFHHMSTIGQVKYMGSAFHLNWQDHGDARGYHLYDSTKQSLKFVENEYSLFVEVAFDKDTFAKMTDDEYNDAFNSKFVRIVVEGEYDNVALLDTISRVNRTKPHDLQVINHSIISSDNATDTACDIEVKVAKSTLEYIESYVSNETDDVKTMMAELYTEAHDQLLKGE